VAADSARGLPSSPTDTRGIRVACERERLWSARSWSRPRSCSRHRASLPHGQQARLVGDEQIHAFRHRSPACSLGVSDDALRPQGSSLADPGRSMRTLPLAPRCRRLHDSRPGHADGPLSERRRRGPLGLCREPAGTMRSSAVPERIPFDERSKRQTTEFCTCEHGGYRCMLVKGHSGAHEAIGNRGSLSWDD
jgi:hypothetical protein